MKRRNFIKMMGFGSVGLGVGANSPLPLLEPTRTPVDFNSGQKLINTGIPELDERINGFVPGELVLVGGRPSMGKTLFALQIARFAALKNNQSVAYFSLGDSKEKLMSCLLSQETGLALSKIRQGKIAENEWPDVIEASQKISSARLLIDDSAALTTKNIQTGLNKLAPNEKADLVIVDYLQLMQAAENCKTPYEAISNLLTELKGIAVQNNLSMVVLVNLAGDSESRSDKRPKLRDFRAGGSFGKKPIGDSDSIDKAILLFRESYYEADLGHNLIEYHIAKNLIGFKGYVRSHKSLTLYMGKNTNFYI